MRRTELLQSYGKCDLKKRTGLDAGRLTQAQAASLLAVGERTFWRYLVRYDGSGLEGLIDQRLEQVSHRRAPAWYRNDNGTRTYSWVKSRLQEAGLGRGPCARRTPQTPGAIALARIDGFALQPR